LKGKNLKVIGSQEWCAFNEFNMPAVHARIDSGARTSSIQATDIKLIKKKGEDWVHFVVYPIQGNTTVSVTCKTKLIGKRSIRGSFGISEERLIIKTPVTIGEDTFDIELSLANRNTMEFRMLLGREAIANRYLINVAKKHLQNTYLKKEVVAMYKLLAKSK
jgi:ribosomal protein S6--L-glutamate ligase